MSSQYFLHGHSQALTANAFTRTNYKFKGWATSSSGSVTYTDKQSLNRSSGSNMTLYANWELLSFTVTLDNQEATTAGTTSVTATNGQPMPSITVPTKTGYTFGGYYSGTNGGGTQYYTASGVSARTCDLTSATTLYAKWTGYTYYVKYNSNGGSGTMGNSTHVYGTSKALSKNVFTRTGYTFAGWATSSSGAKAYSDGQSVSTLTTANGGTVNLYAVWTAITYSVRYNANGGSGTMSNSSHTYGTSKALSANTFTRTGYSFAGWATDANGAVVYSNGQSVSNLSTIQDDTITLYAKWTANSYNVVMDESGFAGLLSPVVGGYENSGWADGEYDTKHVRSGNYSYKITATTASREFYAYTSEAYTINASNKSHIFYIQFWGYQEALIPNSSCQVYWPVEEPCFGPVKYLPLRAANQWNMYSFYGDRSQNALTASTKFRIDFNNLSKAGELWLDDFMIYDLTAIFGAGNEPSKEWCDLMIMTGVAIQELHYDRAENLTAHRSTMVKTGQTFAGWTTTPRTTMTVNKVQYADQAKVSNLTSTKGANVVMYAVWTPRAQKITTDANFVEAVGVLRGAGDYYYGDKVTLRAYAKGNFVFVGWLKNGAEFDGNTAHDVVFYAVSDDKYTAVFKKASSKTDDVYVQIACQDESVESGFGYASYMMTIKSGVAYAHLTAVAADGFKFVGWMISGAMSTSYKTDVVDIPLAEVRGKIVCAVFAKA